MNTFEPGCYFDSHRGHYIVPEIIRFAGDAGYMIDSETQTMLDRYDEHWHEEDYPMEELIEESDAAIEWLNDNRCPDGYVWEWFDGDFGLYPIDIQQ